MHFDGSITVEHRVSVRVLAKTYEHMQRAIDRAYLISVHGDVWKYARLKASDYERTEFLAQYPRQGGIILDAIRDGADAIVERIAAAVRPVFERALQQGIENHGSLAAELQERRRYVIGVREEVPTFDRVAAQPPAHWASAYSNRSIVKEIDQLVGQITLERYEGSTVEVALRGQQASLPFLFDANVARRFHSVAAQRELGPAMIVTAIIRSLDRGNKYSKPSAKILNVETNREVNLALSGTDDCDALHPFHDGRQVRLFVCPIVEALGFDLRGGDLMFLAVA